MASEGEMIEVVELSIEDVISYINSEDCQSPVFTVSINLQFNAVYSHLGCQKRKYFKTAQK